MRTAIFSLIAAAVILSSLSCSGKPSLVGTWEPDMEAMKASEEYKKAPEQEQKMMEGMMSSMTITATKDTLEMSMTVFGMATTKKSKYTITKTDGKNVTIETTELDDEGKEAKDAKPETFTIILDGDTMTMPKSGNMGPVLFKRS